MLSRHLVKYVLTAALRDRLMMVLCVMVLVGMALGIFLGSAAIIEGDRFALVFSASGLRFAGVAGIILFVVFYIRRAFETRDVDFLLSRPLSRVSFIVSHAAAFSLIALLISALITLVIFSFSLGHGGSEQATLWANRGDTRPVVAFGHGGMGVALWGMSLAAEFILMANAALFFAMVLPSATAGAMASFGLYILARLMGEMLGIVNTNAYMPMYRLLAIAMKFVSLLVPRLDLMAQTSWLIYGSGDSAIGAGFIISQGLLYSTLLILAATIDLLRRQF